MVKRLLFSVILLALGCVVSLFVCEALIRLVDPQPDVPRWFEEDEAYAYTLKKNFTQDYRFAGSDFVMKVQTNTLGLRDKPWNPDHATACKRILFLGDSFVFGYGVNVEDRFDTRLSQLLKSQPALYWLVNGGVPGWGTLQESLFARNHFQVFLPDLLVLVFCGNDPEDDALFENGKMIFKEQGMGYFPGKEWLRRHSHLYRFVQRHTTSLRQAMLTGKEKSTTDDKLFDEQSAAVLHEEGWLHSLKTIEQLHAAFLDFNPHGQMILMATNPDHAVIRDHLISLDNGKDLHFLDFSEDLARIPVERQTLPYDRHWSVEVHTLVAENLYRLLKEIP
ncbi:MAG: SGNH/GDSL hydrolase family protein [Candidatus Hydrogenedentales bacterium]